MGQNMQYLWAFLIGGALCAIAQILIDKTALTPARILVSYVVLGVILTGIGVYEPLVKFAGCGATVPLTGFGYSLASGVRESVMKEGLYGVLKGGLTATSAGICASIVLSLAASLVFKGKPK